MSQSARRLKLVSKPPTVASASARAICADAPPGSGLPRSTAVGTAAGAGAGRSGCTSPAPSVNTTHHSSESGSNRFSSHELLPSFVGARVAIVSKGDPPPARRRDAGVSRRRNALSLFMSDDADAGVRQIAEHPGRTVAGTVVSHDNFELDPLLCQHARQASTQHFVSVTGRDDYRNPMSPGGGSVSHVRYRTG